MANDITRFKKDLPPEVNRHIKLLGNEVTAATERANLAEKQVRSLDQELTKARREIAELRSIGRSRGAGGTLGISF